MKECDYALAMAFQAQLIDGGSISLLVAVVVLDKAWCIFIGKYKFFNQHEQPIFHLG